MIHVVLCDDHAMIRRGIRDTLVDSGSISITGEAASQQELKEVLKTAPCAVLVLDLNLPGRGGLEILSWVKEDLPHIKILIVSMYPEDQYAIRCLKAGASGYLNKAGDPSDLVKAIQQIHAGKKFITPAVSEMLVESLATPQNETLHARLSEREMQTLIKIASGKKLSDIAEDLMLSPKTVSVYRARLLEKLSLANNAELTVYAIRNGLV
ncbi:response regulator transcription factor [Rhodoferax sp.]|uniref:response regulator n=1 Tax=Rhodoferax sp. TaxID=50421 RepID=UPI0025F23413|nr:response regulator transcription factor [Rhodoferax sp.]